MKKKTVSVVALDPIAGKSYAKSINNLFGDYAEVRSYSMSDGTASGVLERADLFVVSTDAYGSAEEVARHIPIGCQTMAIEVSFYWSSLRKLKEIPEGSKVLFVNMTNAMAREAIAQLNQFGINHIDFIPFYPGAELTEQVDMAVTPDEERYVPGSVTKIINLGHRPCTSGMMIEIALRLDLVNLLETEKFQKYFRSIATNNYSFDQMFAKSIRLESQFHILMEILEDGVIGVNEKDEIFTCNKHAEDITKVSSNLITGKRGEEVFPYLPFSKCLQEKKTIPAKIVKIHGANISVEVVPVLRQKDCIGAFAILQRFNDVEMKQNELRKQLINKGYMAKYTFDDVIGESTSIRRTKEILKKMAVSESPILLIGETGTGKELFAHAVHQVSRRKDAPFIAVNVGAVPENLLESELFGYEEGAFTGARKGGRPGLFELANKGTLFLDEVEGMSTSLQIKLLRVLQEGEFMRVGGDRMINTDVRVIAATNESLEQMVEEGSFRRDLYYRLNTLPVVIPPLSKREDDMFLLIDRFKDELGGDFVLSDDVTEFLKKYDWPGNIRELRNVVEYFIFTGNQFICLEDLPPTVCSCKPCLSKREAQPSESDEPAKNAAFWFVLGELYKASESHKSLGRDKIYKEAKKLYVPLSQSEIRHILDEMSKDGLVRISKGRGGSQLMPAGRKLWEEHSS